MILVIIGLVALAVGFARGGRLEGLSQVPLRGAVVILSLFVAQALFRRGAFGFDQLSAIWTVWLWCVASVGLIAVCIVNRRVPGMLIIAAGIGLNLLVVMLNAGMPVGGALADSLDMAPTAASIQSSGGFYVPVESATAIPVLGDVIPVLVPGVFRALVSLGDLVMFVGAGVLIEEGMYRGRYQPRHAIGSHQAADSARLPRPTRE